MKQELPYNNCTWFGNLLWRMHVLKMYQNGSSLDGVFNHKHPLSYIVYPILALLIMMVSILMYGFVKGPSEIRREWKKTRFLWSVNEYFRKNPSKFRKFWTYSEYMTVQKENEQ